MKKNKKGFTLVEILIIIAIIAILVSVALVSIVSARQKTKDVSAFTSFRSAAAPVFACLTGNGNLRNKIEADKQICNPQNIINNANWPDFEKYGWDISKPWCRVDYSGSTPPQDSDTSATYNNGTYGGTKGSGDFCIILTNGSKAMWCTINGCYKEGF